MVHIQFETDRDSVSNHIKALFMERLRQYTADVCPATYEEVLRSLAAVYGTLLAPDYTANDTDTSSESTDCECHRFEWLALTEWARFVTSRNYSLVQKSRLSRLFPRLSWMTFFQSGVLRRPLIRFPVASSCAGARFCTSEYITNAADCTSLCGGH